MTTETLVPRAHYAANGVQTAFSFTFPIFAATDMEVWVDQTLQAAGAYAISGVGVPVGGTVIFTVPPPASSQVTLRRRMPLNRTPEFPDTAVQAKPLNEEFRFHTAALQQLADDAALAVKRSFRSLSTADLTLPDPVAGRSIRWNDAGDGLMNSAADVDSVASQAQTAANTASNAALAAQASQNAAASSATAAAASAAALPNAASIGAGKALQSNGTGWVGITALVPADIGASVQGYDANTVKTTSVQTLTSKTLTAPVVNGDYSGSLYGINPGQIRPLWAGLKS